MPLVAVLRCCFEPIFFSSSSKYKRFSLFFPLTTSRHHTLSLNPSYKPQHEQRRKKKTTLAHAEKNKRTKERQQREKKKCMYLSCVVIVRFFDNMIYSAQHATNTYTIHTTNFVCSYMVFSFSFSLSLSFSFYINIRGLFFGCFSFCLLVFFSLLANAFCISFYAFAAVASVAVLSLCCSTARHAFFSHLVFGRMLTLIRFAFFSLTFIFDTCI